MVQRMMCGRIALLALAVLAALPAEARGQRFTGMVAEQLSLDPVEGAVVVLFRVVGPDELTQVGVAATDSTGAFAIPVPGRGTYRVQADLGGLTSALSGPVEFAGDGDGGDVALLLPSPLLQSAMTCQAESEGSAAVVGTLREGDSQVAIPGAAVEISWREGGVTRRLESETDGAGRYRICPPARAGMLEVQTLLFGEWQPQGTLEVAGPSIYIHDLELTLASGSRGMDVIQEQILLEAAAKTLSDLGGEVVDGVTGDPLPFAVIRIQGTGFQTESDAQGRFGFLDLSPGSYVLEIRSLGYEVDSEPVHLREGQNVFLRMNVAPQAVEIEGLEVTARSAAEEVTRVTPFRRAIVYGEIMAQEERRGAMAFETLRRSGPGISVRERYTEYGRVLCIETNRRVQSIGGGCANAQVVVDGIRIPDGAQFLLYTPASQIESIEFVTPVQAQILYGIGGDTANGVVVVYTRGRGPYASPLRNR